MEWDDNQGRAASITKRQGLESISLLDNFDDLSPEKQPGAKKLRAVQSLYNLYEIQLIQQCPDVAHAMLCGTGVLLLAK